MRRQPSDPPSADTPAQARAALAQANALVSDLTGQLTVINADLKTLLVDHASVDAPVVAKVAERDDVKSKLITARGEVTNARDHLQQTIALSFGFGAPDEISVLSAAWPVVLFPVRIETRFDLYSATPSLMVRIYPDDLSIDTHEPGLTAAESAAGVDYWQIASASGEPEAWRKLLVTYPSTRAAWIVLQTAPPSATVDKDFQLFLPPRSAAWTRPAIAVGMPDRFRVIAYRGEQRVALAISNAVVEPLAVSLDPSIDPDDSTAVVDVSGHGLQIDHEIAWTVDFDAAVAAGMAVRIPLQPDDIVHGFDQLFVLGVKSSLQPLEAGAQIASLIEAKHYTAGVGFVRQGTPTHNTSDARSPFPSPDPGGTHSFPIERSTPLLRFPITPGGPVQPGPIEPGVPLPGSGSNGVVFANALGIGQNVTEHIENTDLLEQPHARAFNDALWPGTLGYYMRQMLDPFVTAAAPPPSGDTSRAASPLTIDEETRAHFVEYVRGIAALPPIRVGRKVYGVLPVTSLARWKPDPAATRLDQNLPPLLTTLLGIWSATLDEVPRIGRSSDADSDLLTALGMEARSRRVRISQMIGPTLHFNLLAFLGVPPEQWENQRQSTAHATMAAIGHADWDPLIGWMSFDIGADLFASSLVTDTPSEDDALDPNYINWIRTASVDTLRPGVFPQRPPLPVPPFLLYHVLRYAALTEYDRLAIQMITSEVGIAGLIPRPDAELVGFAPSPPPNARVITGILTAWERLSRFVGSQTIGEYLLDPARDIDGGGAHAYRQSLAAIEGLPSAELERLFASTLDTCSHRLDAWITSLATKRLASMRVLNPTGAHWGAYGWIENLHPIAKPQTETLPDGRIAIIQTSSDGYVQAPTMTHATAGAVLRSAYRTRSGGDSERYGIDLSSDRVRRALGLLAKVRSGESLGSALGHQFERGLRDRATPQLHTTVDSLRRQYPLVANKMVDSHQPADAVAARNVVDGLRLVDSFRDGSIVFDNTVIPAGSDARTAVEDGLHEIADTIDAISDLFTAESIFQSMRGNTTATAASLDAIAGGMRPPELECVQQPRGGTALTHRFAIALGDTAVATPLWTAPSSPRSIAEPHLDGWIGSLLGDPATIRCHTSFPSPSLPNVTGGPDVSLADLQLRPIDFLSLAIDAAENVDGVSELDLHITRFAGVLSVTIDNTPWPDRSIRTFVDAIEAARAIRALIAASRPLRPEDLVAPENANRPAPPVAVPTGRAAAAMASLSQARVNLAANMAPGFDVGQLDAALVKASQFGIKGALSTSPILSPGAGDDLVGRAAGVLSEIDRRLKEAGVPNTPEDEIARAVFGADFVLLPSFLPTRPAELGQALAYAPTLVGSDPLAVPNWIRKAAPVREPVALFRAMALRANALGGAAAPFAVAQLPFAPNASWAALPFPDEAHRPPSGLVSIVLQDVSAPAATGPWTGLLVDEWSEIIPYASEQTAVSLHYDHPRAEAPQAVLVAVPPAGGEVWDFESLFDCVRETLHLAKVRGTDLEMLGTISQIVPALCLASNPAGDAVSTSLSTMLQLSKPPEVRES